MGLEDPQRKKENPTKAEEERFVESPVDREVVSLVATAKTRRRVPILQTRNASLKV